MAKHVQEASTTPTSSRARGICGWLSRFILGAAVVATFAAAAMLLFFALPANDDFVRATRPRELGWWGYVFGFTYMKWQGRWSSCGLESAVLPRLDITRYYWTLIGTIVLVDAIAVYTVIRYFIRTGSKRGVAGITLVLLAVLWAGIPSPNESVYWFTGAVENTMVLAFAAMLLVWLCGPGPISALRTGFLAAFAFITVGFHELYGGMLLMALGIGTLLSFWCRTQNRRTWLVVTLTATAGLAVVVLAPGNNARFATDGGPHSRELIFGLKIALSQFFFYPKWWLADPRILAATVWIICFSSRGPQDATEPSDRLLHKHLLWLCPAVWIAMIAFGFYLPSWAIGAKMPPRTLSGIYLVFVVGWLVNVHLWTRRTDKHRTEKQLPSLFSGPSSLSGGHRGPVWFGTCVAELALAISLLLVRTTPQTHRTGWQTTGHFRDALIDWRDNLTPWHDAVETRYAVLWQTPGGNIRVPPLPCSARLLPSGEIVTPGPIIFTTSIEAYFGVRSFLVIPPPVKEPPPHR